MADPIRYTVRESFNPYARQWEPTLVIVDAPANPGHLVCWAPVGEHSECHVSWYQDRRRSRPVSDDVARAFLARYCASYPATGHGDRPEDYRLVRRIPRDAWRGYQARVIR